MRRIRSTALAVLAGLVGSLVLLPLPATADGTTPVAVTCSNIPIVNTLKSTVNVVASDNVDPVVAGGSVTDKISVPIPVSSSLPISVTVTEVKLTLPIPAGVTVTNVQFTSSSFSSQTYSVVGSNLVLTEAGSVSLGGGAPTPTVPDISIVTTVAGPARTVNWTVPTLITAKGSSVLGDISASCTPDDSTQVLVSTAVTVPAVAPGAPAWASPAAAGGKGSATLTWTAPASNGGSAITGYVVTPYVGGVAQPTSSFGAGAAGSPQTVTGLTNGLVYSFKVAATNAVGTGGHSAASGLVLPPFATFSAFAGRQSLDFLGRAATAAEVTSVTNALLAGGPATAFINTLRRGTDATTNVDPSTRLYFAYFLRIPDKGGLTYWIGQKRAGKSLYAISDFFAASTEFKTRYGSLSNLQFVNLVYQNVLGRAGDAGGIAYWTNQLNTKAKTRGQVMVGYSESSEYRTKKAPSVDVAVSYIDMLGISPDQASFDTWVANLTTGGQTLPNLVAALLADPRYAARL